MQQFQMHVSICGVRVHCSATFEDLDVAVHSAQILNVLNAGHSQCSVDGAEMLDVRIGEKAPRSLAPRQRMLLDIARNFAEIQNEKHREAISQLTRVLAGH